LDDHHFDRLTRALVSAGTRRGLMRGLVTLPVMGAVLASVERPGDVDAKRRKKKRKKKRGQDGKPQPACPPCSADQQCVNGACVTRCKPACDGKACGANDGCGGTCQTGSCGQCLTCQAGACVAVADGTGCDSGKLCVLEATCEAGECTVKTEATCLPPANVCLTASCNPANGICENAPRDAGYPCDTDEVCMFRHGSCDGNGACASVPITCNDSRQHCCPSGEFQGECRRKDWEDCSSNIECCSNSCQFGSCWGAL
jgi:hypothetical protein